MSCGCHTGHDESTLERLQGWQRGNYGFGVRYAEASVQHNTMLPYPGQFTGNVGPRIFNPISMPLPVVGQSGYGGSLPLSQQPRIDIPQPYTYRYIGG